MSNLNDFLQKDLHLANLQVSGLEVSDWFKDSEGHWDHDDEAVVLNNGSGDFLALSIAGVPLNPVTLYPATIAAGSGTEASPYTHGDLTGGIQTEIGALTRGGAINIGASRFNITAADGIRIDLPSVTLEGSAAGFNIDPNGEAEGITGAKISTTTHGVRLGSASAKRGGILLRNLYIYGPNKTGGSEGITVDQTVDQPRIENVNLSNVQYGLALKAGIDAGHISQSSALNCGYGVYANSSAILSYTKFDKCEFSDNDNTGFYAAASSDPNDRWLRISNCTLVRNARTSSAFPANIYLGVNESVVESSVIRVAGHHLTNNTDLPADGIFLAGSRNLVTSCQITDNTNGAGMRISGSNNLVNGCSFSGNLIDVLIESGTGNTITNSGTAVVLNNTTAGIQLANLVGWYRAYAHNSADSAAVPIVVDTCAYHNPLTQTTSANQPAFKTAIQNSQPVFRFDGSNDQISDAGVYPLPFASGDFTVFAVVKGTKPSDYSRHFFGNLANGSGFNGFSFGMGTDGKPFARCRTASTNHDLTDDTDRDGTFFLVSWTRASGTGTYYVNGASKATGDQSGDVTGAGFTLGAPRSVASAENLGCDIAEVILYNEALGTTARQAVETYLNAKYAIY